MPRPATRTGTPARTAEAVFGRVLKRVRVDRGLSQEQLAFESGYHRTYIGQLERGEKSPSLRTLLNLAGALRLTASELVRSVEREIK